MGERSALFVRPRPGGAQHKSALGRGPARAPHAPAAMPSRSAKWRCRIGPRTLHSRYGKWVTGAREQEALQPVRAQLEEGIERGLGLEPFRAESRAQLAAK